MGCSSPNKWWRSRAIWPTSENFDFSLWCPHCPASWDWETAQPTPQCPASPTSPSPWQQCPPSYHLQGRCRHIMAAKNVSQLLPPVAATMDVTYYGSDNCSTSQSATDANCKYHWEDIVCGSQRWGGAGIGVGGSCCRQQWITVPGGVAVKGSTAMWGYFSLWAK